MIEHLGVVVGVVAVVELGVEVGVSEVAAAVGGGGFGVRVGGRAGLLSVCHFTRLGVATEFSTEE
jgi:hypothetical protein